MLTGQVDLTTAHPLDSHERLGRKLPERKHSEEGQSLIIVVLAFVALLGFVGMVTDIGAAYVTYTRLKSAVDAAAVAAANNIKFPRVTAIERKQRITEAARETLNLNEIEDISSLEVFICSESNLPPDFDAMCPDVANGEAPRKLAWVQATQEAPLYFLGLLGVQSFALTVSSVGEAATVDLVLVFDTSESMGRTTAGYQAGDFDPAGCNAANNCQPLGQAKTAARSLVESLFQGYDRVAIVTFDYDAEIELQLTTNFTDVYYALNNFVQLHDDAPSIPAVLPWWLYRSNPYNAGHFNPIFPDDRDGDGEDADPNAVCTPYINPDTGLRELFEKPDPNNVDTWIPCDLDNKLDAFDWNRNGNHEDDGDEFPHPSNTYEDFSILSTCTGCGMRVAKEVLQLGGRQTGVWVIVFLSDGAANLSDMPINYGGVPSSYTYGFCGDQPNNSFWYFPALCKDVNALDLNNDGTIDGEPGRFCIDANSAECPPGTTIATNSKPYSVEDYAMDITDETGLLESDNGFEPIGEDIIIYSIGFEVETYAEPLLRYMANIGEDGSRANDLCAGIAFHLNCGNYYYAPSGAYLNQIFESIANRIFTKISR